MKYNEHMRRLMCDVDTMLTQYMNGEITEEWLQNGIQAIDAALDDIADQNIRDALMFFPDRIEEILYMEFPKNRRKLIEIEVEKLKEIVSL